MQKKIFFRVFTECLYTSPFVDLRSTIVVFRGPIWIGLKNSGSLCVGQVPGTSHVATRLKKHTRERCICPSLSRRFAAGPASSLFVVTESVLDVIRIPGPTVVACPVPPPYFFLSAVFLLKILGTRGNYIACCCLLYFLH